MCSIDTYLEFVRPYYADRDAGHDFRHIERIVRRLDVLSRGLSPHLGRLHFLACFHGLWPKIRDHHEVRSEAEAFLRGVGWPQDQIPGLFRSLERHLNAPETVEEDIVYDANYLEILGAFGIAKAFTVGGARGQTYEETVDTFEHKVLDRVEFRTPVGQQMACEGRLYARDFLARLKSEL